MTDAAHWASSLATVIGLLALAWQYLGFEQLRRKERAQAVFNTEQPVVDMWLVEVPTGGQRLWGRLKNGRATVLAEPLQVPEALLQLEVAGFRRPALRR